MKINLIKASIENAEKIHHMQIKAFRKLLEKYEDYTTNPANENVDKIIGRIKQETTDFYIIKMKNVSVGAIRINKLENGEKCRIAPIFVLPEYQNKGIAQKVFEIIQEKYKPKNGWILDTILEEKGNCYLYEKIGYRKTGKVDNINEKMNIVYYEKNY
jgi:GNAT superfamily N-acetyltransferase